MNLCLNAELVTFVKIRQKVRGSNIRGLPLHVESDSDTL
jgi:hypothetical protein